MTQQQSTGFATWECTPTLDSPRTDRVCTFDHPLLVHTESAYAHWQRVTTVRLVPFERSGQQESASFDSVPELQTWDEFQLIIPEPSSIQRARMRATLGTLPELDWEY